MLRKIHKHTHGWLAAVFVGLLSMAFALWGIQYYLSSNPKTEAVAKVDGDSITRQQFQSAYQRLRDNLTYQYGQSITFDPDTQQTLRHKALQQLVSVHIVSNGLRKAGFVVSPELLQTVITQNPAFQVKGQYNPQLFVDYLRRRSISRTDFITDITHVLLNSQLQSGLLDSAFVLPNEVDQAIKLTEQERDFSYVIIPQSEYLKTVNVPDADVNAYYKKHPDEFQSDEQVSIDYVLLSADNITKSLSVTDQEVKDYYAANSASFQIGARWEVNLITIPLSDANKAAIDKANKQAQQVVIALGAGQKPTVGNSTQFWIDAQNKDHVDVIKHIAQLKPSEISTIWKTDDGVHVAKLLKYEAPKQKSFDEAKSSIKQHLLQQKLEHEFTQQSEQFSELAYTNPDTLSPIEDALGLTIKTTDLFSKDGGKNEITSNPKVIATAFSEDILVDGNNSNPIEIGNGKLVVFRVNQHKTATLLPFDKVKADIVKRLKNQLAQQQVQQLGQKIVGDLRVGKEIDKVLQSHQLKWIVKKKVTRQSPEIDAGIIRSVFKLPKPRTGEVSPVIGAALDNGDYAVVQLQSVLADKDIEITEQQKSVFSESLSNAYGKLDYDLYIQQLTNDANVEMLIER